MPLLIAEELLLTALRPDGAVVRKGNRLDLALGGALLVELVLAGRVALDGKRVLGTDPGQPSNPPPGRRELTEAYQLIAAKPRKPKSCVQRLSKRARVRLRYGLVTQGVLSEREHRVLGVFPVRRYALADPRAHEEVTRRLRAAVTEGKRPDERTAAVAGLVHAAGLDRTVFPHDDRKAVKRRLAEIAEGDWAAGAVRDAIKAAQAATAAAAAVAASSAASS